MGHPPILAGLARQQAADRLSAALMAPFMRCRCGFTYHHRTLWNNPERAGPRFYCVDCIPDHLRPLVAPVKS